MKINILALLTLCILTISGCNNKIEENFNDPSKTTNTSLEYLMSGTFEISKDYYMPYYHRHFVFTNNSVGIYCQSKGWVNGLNMYVPGNGTTERWNNYYKMMRQYREFETKFASTGSDDKRIFLLASKIFFFDQTQQIVDMWGDIPWKEAGRLKENNGNINASKAKYDSAEEIYTTMLDELKAIADELSSISIPTLEQTSFTTQDLINKGDIASWKKYCNSLRLRMLVRVSDVSSFSSRAKSEIKSILDNPTKYPIISNNSEIIQVEAEGSLTHDNQGEKGIRGALESWSADNVASKSMISNMLENNDPRLEAMFAPNISGVYVGLDPMLDASTQDKLIGDNALSRLDSATFSRNIYVPGIFISAAEVSLLKAEAITKGLCTGDAKKEYENGIKQAIEQLYSINALCDYAPPLTVEQSDIESYIASANINWDNNANKMKLIGTQRWLNFHYLQPEQSWIEIRRTGYPELTFKEDQQADVAKVPPFRFLYPTSETSFNSENYQEVASKNTLLTKIFWDVD
ncbi:MAG: SusD/RagB family nutrient-binding outer membrane lipoprotein [Bacteroidales bacterium]